MTQAAFPTVYHEVYEKKLYVYENKMTSRAKRIIVSNREFDTIEKRCREASLDIFFVCGILLVALQVTDNELNIEAAAGVYVEHSHLYAWAGATFVHGSFTFVRRSVTSVRRSVTFTFVRESVTFVRRPAIFVQIWT